MIDWQPSDAVGLRDYLQTKSGGKLLIVLKRPKSEGSSIEEVCMSAKFADGIEYVKDLIERLAYTQAPLELSPGYITWDRDNK